MRARYYSPEMKRFVNADIVAGEISNAVTLNRFAYANGNPVSFVDPFGLSVWSRIKEAVQNAIDKVKELWSDVKDWITEQKNKAKTHMNNLPANIKTEALKADSAIDYPREYYNYEYNSENDIMGRLVEDQKADDVAKMMLGKHSLKSVGCEVIAVYNAKYLLGITDVSMAATIETFENNGAIVAELIMKGGYGSNPFSLDKVFKAEGLKYSVVNSFNAISDEPGVYVVSFWNSNALSSALHTVAVSVDDKGALHIYNGANEEEFEPENVFITGYKVSRK